MAGLLVGLVGVAVIAMVVLAHYEALGRVSGWLARAGWGKRRRLLLGVFACLAAHVASVWIFAVAYYMLIAHGGFGGIAPATTDGAPFVNSMSQCFYFSIVNYTSLGYGDWVPLGPIGVLAGLEALTGLMLIAWSASFIFLQTQRLARAPAQRR